MHNLASRRVVPGGICPICQTAEETIEHAILLCPWTRAVWFGSKFQWTINPNGLTSFDRWLLKGVNLIKSCSTDLETDLAVLSCIVWNVWKKHCKAIYQSVNPNPWMVIFIINSNQLEWNQSLHSNNQELREEIRTIPDREGWTPPPEGFIKINVDASWLSGNPFCSIGCVARDSNANVLLSSCRKVLAPTPLIAETLAIREGALIGHNLGWNNISIESDCKVAVDAYDAGKQMGEIRVLIQDIKDLQQRFQSCRVKWIARCKNQVSHLIAQLGLKNLLPPGWLWNLPKPIQKALIEDGRGIPPRF
ncbi:uncharacterized protein LOC130737294 [Lotus japonicus]|uniref:uncharacterized protein LOC130737294 n=1 Tax=Lotus japonicus TaxID=34305 RepID=UPI0025889387|nr:uncharacterized protein LOC130737294 [Lotus japonicus]